MQQQYPGHNDKIVFVMFLSVDKRLRSKAHGSAVLAAIEGRHPHKKIIISIEPCDDGAPDIELRERRKAFYLRNGYKEAGYRVKLNGMEQEIIVKNGEFSKREFRIFLHFTAMAPCTPKSGSRQERVVSGKHKARGGDFIWSLWNEL